MKILKLGSSQSLYEFIKANSLVITNELNMDKMSKTKINFHVLNIPLLKFDN
jgi:hypothetical protein